MHPWARSSKRARQARRRGRTGRRNSFPEAVDIILLQFFKGLSKLPQINIRSLKIETMWPDIFYIKKEPGDVWRGLRRQPPIIPGQWWNYDPSGLGKKSLRLKRSWVAIRPEPAIIVAAAK
jgi:hypothetical protein